MSRYGSLLSSLRTSLAYWKHYTTLQFTMSLYGLMKQRGVSQKKLAKLLSISPARISQVLNGGENLTIETMAKMALALDAAVHIQVVPKSNVGAFPKNQTLLADTDYNVAPVKTTATAAPLRVDLPSGQQDDMLTVN